MRVVLQLVMFMFMIAALICSGISLGAWALGISTPGLLWGAFWCAIGVFVCVLIDVIASAAR